MSLGYADKLKRKKNVGGQLGATEFYDDVQEAEEKMKKVANLVRSRYLGMPCHLPCRI